MKKGYVKVEFSAVKKIVEECLNQDEDYPIKVLYNNLKEEEKIKNISYDMFYYHTRKLKKKMPKEVKPAPEKKSNAGVKEVGIEEKKELSLDIVWDKEK